MELKLSQSCLPSAIFNSSSFFPKRFTLLAQKWDINIRRISWKGNDISNKILVHVVKEGETLSSIAKLYGVPIIGIAAANKEISDVYEGQHLNIPSAFSGDSHVCQFEGNPSLGFLSRQWKQILTVVPSSRRLLLAKTTGSFLLLVPLIAICIGCIMGAFQYVVARNMRRQSVKRSKLHHHRSNGIRWKTALSDLGDPDSTVAESEPDSDQLSEDEGQYQFEDMCHAYTKLEGDYQKFLSECGMSNWGYWRGGSPQ